MSKKLVLTIIGVTVIIFAGFLIFSRTPAPKEDAIASSYKTPEALTASRSYLMGFSLLLPPPDKNPNKFIPKKLAMMARYSDAAVEHPDIPWKELLAGKSPKELINGQLLPPINLLRSKGLKVFLMLEPLNGLDRKKEHPELLEVGRSIKEPAVQRLYKEYALAVARIIKPDYFGLAAEVNGFRALGDKPVYDALVKMVNDAAREVKRENPTLPLYVSVAGEIAWGVAPQHQKNYQGVEESFGDFPFIDALSITTYPQQLYDTPEEIPGDYFSRLLSGRKISVIIDESGWGSKWSQKRTSQDMQVRWIKKLEGLAETVNTIFIAQLLFQDASPRQVAGQTIEFFATQGLTDHNLNPKPALETWEKIFLRTYKPKSQTPPAKRVA